jgi:hypothetical protein
MAPEKVEAGRGRHLAPAPDCVSADAPDLTSPLHVTQTHRLAQRYGLERNIAALVAELAFQSGRLA